MSEKWEYTVITRHLTPGDEVNLVDWCYENFGELDVNWTGYFVGRNPNRSAIVYVDYPAYHMLLTLTWT